MRIIIDNNVWISYAFGKRLADLPRILNRTDIQIYTSEAQIAELLDVFSRPKITKYLSAHRIDETIQLVRSMSEHVPVVLKNAQFQDPKDNFYSICPKPFKLIFWLLAINCCLI